MRNKTASSTTTVRLLENARYEVLPTASIEAKLLEHVPLDRTITVTASPAKGLATTLDLAERLARHGYTAVPHLAARMIRDRAELAEICDRLAGLGITGVFVPAGDASPPGSYPDALTLLEDLAFLGNPFSHIGITGYPESHPTITDDLTPKLEAAIVQFTYWYTAAAAIAEILETQTALMHACEAETSMMLAVRPELVAMHRAALAKANSTPDVTDVVGGGVYRWRTIGARSSSGVIGNPEAATAEKGERLFEAIASALANKLCNTELWQLPWQAERIE